MQRADRNISNKYSPVVLFWVKMSDQTKYIDWIFKNSARV